MERHPRPGPETGHSIPKAHLPTAATGYGGAWDYS